MREDIVVRSYAQTLFKLAERHGGASAWRTIATEVATLTDDPAVQGFLATPRIAPADRQEALERALHSAVPAIFLRFLLVVVDRRRQRLIPAIMRDFLARVDRREGIRRMEVTVAREPAPAEAEALQTRLSDTFGAVVFPNIRVQPDIIGGIVIREGDILYDGSIKRQLESMRRTLMHIELQ